MISKGVFAARESGNMNDNSHASLAAADRPNGDI